MIKMKKLNYFALLLLTAALSSCSGSSGGGGSDDDIPPVDPVNEAPAAVSSLVYPTNNLLCIDNTITFEWGASTDPNGDTVSYVIEIADDNQFSNIVESTTVSATSKTYTLEKGKAFYWRVQAKDDQNLSSDYSNIFQFYTEGVGEVNHLPFSPELIAPALNGNLDSGAIDLRWNGSDVDGDTLTYDVYFDTSNPPNTKVGDNQSDKTYTVNTASSTTYYWKVVVKDDKGGEALGQVWSFSTN